MKNKKVFLVPIILTGAIPSVSLATACNNTSWIKVELTSDSTSGVKIVSAKLQKNIDSTINIVIPDNKEVQSLIVSVGDKILKPDEQYEFVSNTITIKANAMDGGNIKIKVILKDKEIHKTLVGIEIDASQCKKNYKLGETLDLTNLVVTAKYGDSTTAVVTNYDSYPENGKKVTILNNTVTISYTERGITKIANFPISVTSDQTVMFEGSDVYIVDLPTLFSQTANITGTLVNTNKTKQWARGGFLLPIVFGNDITEFGDNFLYGCTFYNQDIVIPNTVTKIGANFLSNCSGFNSKVTLSNQLQSIGENFMNGCLMFNQEINVPGTVETIPNNFLVHNTRFNSKVTLNEGTKHIGNKFIANCESFNQKFVLPSTITTIGNEFLCNTKFNNGDEPEVVTKPFILSNSITSIGTCFLKYTNFNQSINIPNTIQTINEGFLAHSSFNQEIVIPSSVNEIQQDFLCSCTNFNNGCAKKVTTKPFTIPATVRTIKTGFLTDCRSFNQQLIIENGVQEIESLLSNATAFNNGCAKDVVNQPLIIPTSITSINAFLRNCESFNQVVDYKCKFSAFGQEFMSGCKTFNQKIEISSDTTILHGGFLADCLAFNNGCAAGITTNPLVLPNGITKIGGNFLSGCSSFNQELNIPTNVENIGDNFLLNCNNDAQNITIGANSKLKNFPGFNTATQRTFVLTDSGITFTNGLLYNTNLKTALGASGDFDGVITNGCEHIADSFLTYNTTFNKKITIPQTVIDIGINFLKGCENFNNGDDSMPSNPITIGSACTAIGQHFLSGCKKFNQEVDMSTSSITQINDRFLFECESFNQPIQLPINLTEIDSFFLAGCAKFNQKITLPTTINTIKAGFMSGQTAFNNGCAEGVVENDFTIPPAVVEVGNNFLWGCKSFNQRINLGSVKDFGAYFLSDCTKFNQKIVLPAGTKELEVPFLGEAESFNNSIDFRNVSTNIVIGWGGLLQKTPETNTIKFIVPAGQIETWKPIILDGLGRQTLPNNWTIVDSE